MARWRCSTRQIGVGGSDRKRGERWKSGESFWGKEGFVFSNGMGEQGNGRRGRGTEFFNHGIHGNREFSKRGGFEGVLDERMGLFLAKEWWAKEWPEKERGAFLRRERMGECRRLLWDHGRWICIWGR